MISRRAERKKPRIISAALVVIARITSSEGTPGYRDRLAIKLSLPVGEMQEGSKRVAECGAWGVPNRNGEYSRFDHDRQLPTSWTISSPIDSHIAL